MFNVKTYDATGKRLLTEEWYDVDNGDGTYSQLREIVEYTYNGNKLTQRTESRYRRDGSLIETRTYGYYTNGNKIIVKEVED